MLGKRKEKLIRDIVEGVIAAVERIVERVARPRREALEREEVERIAAIVVEAIQADMIEWRQVTISPGSESRKHINKAEMMKAYGWVAPKPVEPDSQGDKSELETPQIFGRQYRSQPIHPWVKDFGDFETDKFGRLAIERMGPADNDLTLLARLSDADSDLPHLFKQGTLDECRAGWVDAVEWMAKKFPKSEPVGPESVEPDPPVDPQFDKKFGNRTTGVIGRLIIEPDGPKNARYRLMVYSGGTENFHVFKRGTITECEAAWPEAVKWMEKRFPENKA